ncbi:AAA family ATPase, partial [Tamlana crocina]|nr:AAA family ATPase [Tamlana crocina]
ELYFTKSSIFTENEIFPNLHFEDLDQELFTKARNLIRSNRSDHPWMTIKDEELLKEASLWRKDFRTGQEGLTLAAALIFGKDTTIQSLLPAY